MQKWKCLEKFNVAAAAIRFESGSCQIDADRQKSFYVLRLVTRCGEL